MAAPALPAVEPLPAGNAAWDDAEFSDDDVVGAPGPLDAPPDDPEPEGAPG